MSKLGGVCVLIIILAVGFFWYTNKSKTNEVSELREDIVVIPDTKTSLDLSQQGLSSTPQYLFERTELEELNLSHNNLTGALPAEIRQLKDLRVLNLSHNNFTGVPAEVGQLSKLEVLDLSYNQLTGLPYELGNLSNLKVLDLRGNAYATQDLVVIKQGLANDVEIYTD